MILPEQNPCLGPVMAGEHYFPISPEGSKAPQSGDLRGQAKFKMLTASEDPVFPGNGKSKTLPVQTVYLIHFTSPSTNEVVCQKTNGLRVFRFPGLVASMIEVTRGRKPHTAHSLTPGYLLALLREFSHVPRRGLTLQRRSARVFCWIKKRVTSPTIDPHVSILTFRT